MKALMLIVGSFSLLTLGCGDGGGTTGASLANCSAFCSKFIQCTQQGTQQQCESECNANAQQAQAISAQCLGAFSAVNSCVSGLTCEQGQAWAEEIPPDSYPCKAQDDATTAACS